MGGKRRREASIKWMCDVEFVALYGKEEGNRRWHVHDFRGEVFDIWTLIIRYREVLCGLILASLGFFWGGIIRPLWHFGAAGAFVYQKSLATHHHSSQSKGASPIVWFLLSFFLYMMNLLLSCFSSFFRCESLLYRFPVCKHASRSPRPSAPLGSTPVPPLPTLQPPISSLGHRR